MPHLIKMTHLTRLCIAFAGFLIIPNLISTSDLLEERVYSSFDSKKIRVQSTTVAPIITTNESRAVAHGLVQFPEITDKPQKHKKKQTRADASVDSVSRSRFGSVEAVTNSHEIKPTELRDEKSRNSKQLSRHNRLLFKRLAIEETINVTTIKPAIIPQTSSAPLREGRQLSGFSFEDNAEQSDVPIQHQSLGVPTRVILSNRRKVVPFTVNFTREGYPERSTTGLATQVVVIPSKLFLPADAFRSNFRNRPRIKVTGIYDSNTNQTLAKADSRCPKLGVLTLEHPHACDKYYYCEDGLLSEQTCPNGLMYGVKDLVVDFCIHRWQASCSSKSIPDPISSPGCRWQYGLFKVQGSPKCSSSYYECAAGKFTVKRCHPEGYVYDDRSKSCQAPHIVGCVHELVANFRCPSDDQTNAFWPFPRYYLNKRALIHCVNDKAELVQCMDDEQVDPEFLQCLKPGETMRL